MILKVTDLGILILILKSMKFTSIAPFIALPNLWFPFLFSPTLKRDSQLKRDALGRTDCTGTKLCTAKCTGKKHFLALYWEVHSRCMIEEKSEKKKK